jgi:acyl-CoA dehydrogenase
VSEADVASHFADYLEARRTAPLLSPVLQAWAEALSPAEAAWLDGVARRVRGPWDEAAAEAEREGNLPRVTPGGDLTLCAPTWTALSQVHGSGLWDPGRDERARYAAVMLLNQNGEGGVACSVACTDGLVRVLRRHGGHPEVLRSLETMTPEQWTHGAQFVTEIQGGSDAATNQVRAEPVGDGSFALHGQKWFCSNLTADWWLVTARPAGAPAGARGVGLFLVPRAGGGFTVERLKDKVGTRALPTAEIRFHGARGRPVGPLDQGLKTMVSEVLVPSRLHNIVAVAGFLRRAEREAAAYAVTRTAFGRPLAAQPLLADVLRRLQAAADLAEAGACATVDAWLASLRPGATAEQLLLARVLVSLHKAVATREAQPLLQEAMSVLGGNGIEERFSALPRLWRDSVILETWEGPYTLLLSSALGDLRRAGVAGTAGAAVFLRSWHGGDPPGPEVAELAAILGSDPDDAGAALAWRGLAHRLVAGWARRALSRLR